MKKKIFKGRTEALSETTFLSDGTMVNKCTYEKPELTDGDSRKMVQGRMVYYDDGESIFRPYSTGGQSTSTKLAVTEHGELKEFPKSIVLKVKFEKSMTQQQLVDVILDEMDELALAASILIQMLNNKKKEETK